MLEAFMADFAKEMEWEELPKTTSPGTYQIPLEEDVTILVTERPPGFILSSNVAALPKQRLEEFLIHVLHGNLFGQGTQGAVLGASENGNLLTLSRTVDYSVNYKDFKNYLEDFINTIDFWREEALNHK